MLGRLRQLMPVNVLGGLPSVPRSIALRIARAVAVIVLAAVLDFVLFVVLPDGDPARLRAGPHAGARRIAHVRAAAGLGASLLTQLWRWLRGVLHLNVGYSYVQHRTVLSAVVGQLPGSLSLLLGAAILAALVAVPLAVAGARPPAGRRLGPRRLGMRLPGAAGLRRGVARLPVSAVARVPVSAVAGVLAATPVFWLGLIGVYLFATDIGSFAILPGAGRYVGLTSNPVKWFTSLLLPWLILAAAQGGIWARVIGRRLDAALGSDATRAARAAGLAERTIVGQRALRSAVLPLSEIAAIELAALIGAVLLTEVVFAIPGVGLATYRAATGGDLALVQGTVMLATILIVVVGTVADVVGIVRSRP